MLCYDLHLFLLVFFFFFFFKQKTAYEMRISDWSSGRVLFRSLIFVPAGATSHGERNIAEAAIVADEPPEVLRGGMVNLGAIATEFLQIGRASCRERVCQYV